MAALASAAPSNDPTAPPTVAQLLDVAAPQRRQKWPVGTGVTVLALVAIFVANAATPGALEPEAAVAHGWALAWPPLNNSVWWRLGSCVLFHWSVAHLVVNLAALGLLGSYIEVRYGWPRALAIMASGGVAGAVFFVAAATLRVWLSARRAMTYAAMAPDMLVDAGVPPTALAGASGAVYALVGAYVGELALNPELVASKALHATASALLVGGMLAESILAGRAVAVAAHVGGLAWGVAPALLCLPNARVARYDFVLQITAVAVACGFGFLGALIAVALYAS